MKPFGEPSYHPSIIDDETGQTGTAKRRKGRTKCESQRPPFVELSVVTHFDKRRPSLFTSCRTQRPKELHLVLFNVVRPIAIAALELNQFSTSPPESSNDYHEHRYEDTRGQ